MGIMPSSCERVDGACCTLIRSRDLRANFSRSSTKTRTSTTPEAAAPNKEVSVLRPSLLVVLLPLLVVFLAPNYGSGFVVPSTTGPFPLLSTQWRGSKPYYNGGSSSSSSSTANRVLMRGLLGRPSNEVQQQQRPLMMLPTAATAWAGSRTKALRASETRRSAMQDDKIEGLADVLIADTEVLPVEKSQDDLEPAERPPFDLDAAVFLADFAFEAYRDPGKVAWEVPGPNNVLFLDGKLVSMAFPGLLTVSLLAVEGLPEAVEPNGGDDGNRKREINPSVAMVLADKDMRSETMKSTKRPLPGSRCWGELFSVHVHDPETSVLEVGLWDSGEDGSNPLSMSGVFKGEQELVGNARVPLSKILKKMSRSRDDVWTGWIELDPVQPPQEKRRQQQQHSSGESDHFNDAAATAASASAVAAAAAGTGGGRDRDGDARDGSGPARLHLDLRFVPMERYLGDKLPTAPRASEEEVWGLGTIRARWQSLVGQGGDEGAVEGDDAASASAAAVAAAARVVAARSPGDEDVAVYARPGLPSNASRTFLYDEDGNDEGGGGGGGVSSLNRNPMNNGESDRKQAQTKGGETSSSTKVKGGEGGGGWPWSKETDEADNGKEAGSPKGKSSSGGGGGKGQGVKTKKIKNKDKKEVAEVVLREDGLPDWSVLTNRIGGLAQQGGSFELLCFIDNHDTDTQAGVWRDEAEKRLVVSFRGTAQFEDVLTDVNFLLEDLDSLSTSSSAREKSMLPAVDDVMAAVLNTTSTWKKERVQPLPKSIAQQKVYMLESMSKLLDTSRDLLKDLQATTTTTTTAATATATETSTPPAAYRRSDGTKGDDDHDDAETAEATGRPQAILSGVKKVLRAARGAEPASASEIVDLDVDGNASGEADQTRVAANAAAAAEAATNLIDLLDDSNVGNSSGGEGDGGVRAGVRNLWRRVKGKNAASGEGERGGGGGGGAGIKIQDAKKVPDLIATPTKAGGGTAGGLVETLAWVQQVAEEKMEEIVTLQSVLGDETLKQMQLLSDITEGKVNATESGEMLALFLREQLEKVEATKELVDRVEDFRDSIGAVGIEWDGNAGGLVGLEALQKRVQDRGRKAIDEKIAAFQAVLDSVTALQQQQQQQQWADGIGISDGASKSDGYRDVDKESASPPSPKVHAGFKKAYNSVKETLAAVVGSAIDGKPEEWHVYVTGHSLGGALATLAALDHMRRYPNANVTMYNFGSPRVGNRAFAQLYDSYVGDSFRIVNNLDAVARMPRATMRGISLDYSHSGRTVMVAEDPEEAPWIQGESEGECPLEETDPIALLTKGNADFWSGEIDFMKALVSGKGIDHHTEFNYFAALDSFYDRDDTNNA
ncbi:unnamed protein product [Pylaiella littoralis]